MNMHRSPYPKKRVGRAWTFAAAVGLIAALLLSGCGKAPAETPDASAAPTTASTTVPTVPTAETRSTGSRNSDGVLVDWELVSDARASAGGAAEPNICTYSPYYSKTFTPRGDYGTLHTYAGAFGTMAYVDPIYGLMDAQLRILTPAIYYSIGSWGNTDILFLRGSTWRAEDDPRIKRAYDYDAGFEYLYQRIQVIAPDGSWMLDDEYCFSERITGGFMLFSIDGSLTLIDDKGKVTSKLSGGDYCWVQPIDKGRLFAFHGFDGAVTVRDRTGKTVSRFTKAQMGDDVRYTAPNGIYPEVELVWKDSIGYVQHNNDSTGRTWITRYLYADTGEVKKPPVKGLVRNDHVVSDEADSPEPPQAAPAPEVIKSYPHYEAVRDTVTGKSYYYTTEEKDDKAEYDLSVPWTLRDGTGKALAEGVNPFNSAIVDGYLESVISVEDVRNDRGTVTEPRHCTTRILRLSDGKCVFRYAAVAAEYVGCD